MNRYQMQRDLAIRQMTIGCGGATVHAQPVSLEPPYERFSWHEGVRISPPAAVPAPTYQPPLRFVRILPSADDMVSLKQAPQLLVSLPIATPLAFEIVGSGDREPRVAMQFALRDDTRDLVASLRAQAHKADIYEAEDILGAGRDQGFAVQGWRLDRSHLFPLCVEHLLDPYGALLGVLTGLEEREVGALQVLFVPVAHDWPHNIMTVANDPFARGTSAFKDLPDLPKLADRKTAWPLFAVALRIVGSSQELMEKLSGFLAQYRAENSLLPVPKLPPSESASERTTYTTGMLLNAQELATLVHLPSGELVERRAIATADPGSAPPRRATTDLVYAFGRSRHQGVELEIGFQEEWLRHHCVVFGAPGYGKTTFLLHLAKLVDKGYGLAFLDPKGDAAEKLLTLIPKHRVGDTIYFNPADREFPPALNVLEASSDREREKLADDLLVALRRLFESSWGPRLEWLLRESIRTLLASKGEKTLRDVPLLLSAPAFRADVLRTVDDPDLQWFWEREFSRVPKNATHAVLNKISKFVDNPLVRNIIAQQNRIDFHRVIEEGKVFVANLSKGRLGEDAAVLLGSFILSRLQLATMARAEVPEAERWLFVIAVDEFHNYAREGQGTASIESFFAEARQLGVGLVCATQYVSQMSRNVIAAIFGTAGTFISFRCGALDAQLLQREFGDFEAQDIMDLKVGEAILRMGASDESFRVRVKRDAPEYPHKSEIVEMSRERYARPRKEVEDALVSRKTPEPGMAALQEPRAVLVDADARAFLKEVCLRPQAPVTAICRRLHFGGSKSERIRTLLKEQGLIEEVATRLGHRGTRAIFAIPGYAACELLNVELPSGRGGTMHRHFQRLVADYGARLGYEAEVEASVPGGAVDVALVRGGERLAVEISITSRPADEVRKITSFVNAGYTRIYVLCLKPETAEEIKRLVANGASLVPGANVIVGGLHEFHKVIV